MRKRILTSAVLSVGLLLGGCSETNPETRVTAQQLKDNGCKSGEKYRVAGNVALLGKNRNGYLIQQLCLSQS
ncbi:hypothetical protein IPL68_05875 [Candidatus Saccharibacteria bacterium]|nr:MAG: hypothetical protein IPL68_05875 [Candidatus Saccharibacteria bacterium]